MMLGARVVHWLSAAASVVFVAGCLDAKTGTVTANSGGTPDASATADPSSGTSSSDVIEPRRWSDLGGISDAPRPPHDYGWVSDTTVVADTSSVSPDLGNEPPVAGELRAVVIEDSWVDTKDCPSKGQNAQGADIDAVALVDADGSLLGYLHAVRGQVPDASFCGDNEHPDVLEALHSPDAIISGGYVSLTGGALVGEFGPDSPRIMPGDHIAVYEVDQDTCQGCNPEAYTVWLTNRLSCLGGDGCEEHWLGTGYGSTELAVPASAF